MKTTELNMEPFTDAERCDAKFEGYILKTLDIFEVPHHMEFIRVVDVQDLAGNLCQQPYLPGYGGGNIERYNDMQRSYEGWQHTVQIPGIDGDWICRVFPFAD